MRRIQYGNYVVNLNLSDSNTFYQVTSQVAAMGSGQNLMVAWLDYEEGESYAAESRKEDPAYISAATVSEGINGDSAQISGNFTLESATELADLINSGSLPVQMTEIYSDVVSADYGMDAFSSTMLARRDRRGRGHAVHDLRLPPAGRHLRDHACRIHLCRIPAV